MVLEKLGNAFKKAISSIANAIFLDKKKVESIVKELQRALLEADVEQDTALQVIEELKNELVNKTVKKGQDLGEFLKIRFNGDLKMIVELCAMKEWIWCWQMSQALLDYFV